MRSESLNLIILRESLWKTSTYKFLRLFHFYFHSEIIQAFAKIKGGINGMALSSNGSLLAISTTNGIIGVISVRSTPPQLCFVIEDANYFPHILKFSQDSGSQLITLDLTGRL